MPLERLPWRRRQARRPELRNSVADDQHVGWIGAAAGSVDDTAVADDGGTPVSHEEPFR
jgi:hypothetical protein